MAFSRIDQLCCVFLQGAFMKRSAQPLCKLTKNPPSDMQVCMGLYSKGGNERRNLIGG